MNRLAFVRGLTVTAALAGMYTWCGCSRSPGTSVSGHVTLDGELMSSGTVTFHPVGGGPLGYGRIAANGVYTIHTGQGGAGDSPDSGLSVGDYRITVVATMPTIASPSASAPEVGKLITPEHYGDVERSGVRFAVSPGENVIDITLVSGGAADDDSAAQKSDADHGQTPNDQGASPTRGDGKQPNDPAGAQQKSEPDKKLTAPNLAEAPK